MRCANVEGIEGGSFSRGSCDKTAVKHAALDSYTCHPFCDPSAYCRKKPL